MDLFEYQGKTMFAAGGLPVPEGRVAATPDEASAIAAELGGEVVVKAQVLTGGRGKAGGIALASDPMAARESAQRILGMDIKGHQVRRVLVEGASAIEQELYAALILDRGTKTVLAMLSRMGGMDVEEVAHSHPDALARVHVDPLAGWSPYHGRRLCFEAGVEPHLTRPLSEVFSRLWAVFHKNEATLVEINPLAVVEDGSLVAVDAKVTLDNNALFRHPDLADLRDVILEAGPAEERLARERDLTYVKLNGTIGVLGNGAGLVMSTLDVVANAGGRPANFLDVGGGARADEIVAALEVITSDPQVNTILFNIFGGITRCDEVARGMLTAVAELGIDLPLVVRLVGTNEEEGRAIVAGAVEQGLVDLYPVAGMVEAAELAVSLAARPHRSDLTGDAENGVPGDPPGAAPLSGKGS
jgi:succinyl-CoA synthetase beta subunit